MNTTHSTGIVVEWVKQSWFSIHFNGKDVPVSNFGLFQVFPLVVPGWVLKLEFTRMSIDVDVAELLLVGYVASVFGAQLHSSLTNWLSGASTNLFQASGASSQGGIALAILCVAIRFKFI